MCPVGILFAYVAHICALERVEKEKRGKKAASLNKNEENASTKTRTMQNTAPKMNGGRSVGCRVALSVRANRLRCIDLRSA